MIKTKTLHKVFSKPFLVLISIFFLLAGSLISEFYSFYLASILLILALTIIIVSVVYSIVFKKWRLLFKYILIHFFIIPLSVLIIGISLPQGPDIISGNENFYANKFKYHTSIDVLNDFDIYCKQDTIYGIGPGGGDYRATCIYSVNKKQVELIEKKLKTDSVFQKVSFDDYKEIILETQNFNCSKKIIYNDSGYKSGNGMYSYIVFSKDKKYMLFCIDYY